MERAQTVVRADVYKRQERRRFLDSEICQLSRLYMIELANYNKVVAQLSLIHIWPAFSLFLAAFS